MILDHASAVSSAESVENDMILISSSLLFCHPHESEDLILNQVENDVGVSRMTIFPFVILA